MANGLSNIMNKILARSHMVLRQWATMPRIVNLDYALEAKERGDTIDVPIPSDISDYDITPSNTEKQAADQTPTKVQIQLNKWKGASFYLTDKDQLEIDKQKHFIPPQTIAAVKSLANRVNQDIFAKYTKLYGYVGTAGTTPFATTVNDATALRKVLNQQLCPLEDRRGMLDFEADAQALNLSAFSDADKRGDGGQTKLRGQLGTVFGFDWFADHHVPKHTTGTLSNGSTHSALVNGAVAVGGQTVNIDSTTLTGTVVTGDIFTVAGDTQTYVVTNSSTLTASGNAIAGITFEPPSVLGFADNAAITFKDTHRVNLGFHRDCFALAVRPVQDSSAGLALGSQIEMMQDPLTGLVLRLEVRRQNKQTLWEFDILYGTECVRRELGARLAG